MIKTNLKNFYSAIFAGICIGLGGFFSLVIPNRYVGAAAFSIGIFMAMSFDLKLYTGFVPTLSEKCQFGKQFINVLMCWLGNFIGAFAMGSAVSYCCGENSSMDIVEKSCSLMDKKFTSTFITDGQVFKTFLLAILCGIVISLIVRNKNNILKWIFTIPLIMLFILTGMEHCVADIFYAAVTNHWSILTLIFILVVSVGNTIGGYLAGKLNLL